MPQYALKGLYASARMCFTLCCSKTSTSPPLGTQDSLHDDKNAHGEENAHEEAILHEEENVPDEENIDDDTNVENVHDRVVCQDMVTTCISET